MPKICKENKHVRNWGTKALSALNVGTSVVAVPGPDATLTLFCSSCPCPSTPKLQSFLTNPLYPQYFKNRSAINHCHLPRYLRSSQHICTHVILSSRKVKLAPVILLALLFQFSESLIVINEAKSRIPET